MSIKRKITFDDCSPLIFFCFILLVCTIAIVSVACPTWQMKSGTIETIEFHQGSFSTGDVTILKFKNGDVFSYTGVPEEFLKVGKEITFEWADRGVGDGVIIRDVAS